MAMTVRNDRVARYLEFVGRGDALEVLSARMMDGEGLREICRSMDIPQTRVLHWLMEDVGRWEVYERCLRVCADMEVEETIRIADEQKEVRRPDGTTYDPDVARDKLRIETRMRRAKHYDAGRFGERVDVKHSGVEPTLNVVLVGVPMEAISAPVEGGRVIEGEKAGG